jgi:hypothetical protein
VRLARDGRGELEAAPLVVSVDNAGIGVCLSGGDRRWPAGRVDDRARVCDR